MHHLPSSHRLKFTSGVILAYTWTPKLLKKATIIGPISTEPSAQMHDYEHANEWVGLVDDRNYALVPARENQSLKKLAHIQLRASLLNLTTKNMLVK